MTLLKEVLQLRLLTYLAFKFIFLIDESERNVNKLINKGKRLKRMFSFFKKKKKEEPPI
jgi:hypothetical protein